MNIQKNKEKKKCNQSFAHQGNSLVLMILAMHQPILQWLNIHL